jgi:hypothetical protein
MQSDEREIPPSIRKGISRRTVLKRIGYGSAGVYLGSNAVVRLLRGGSLPKLAAGHPLAARLGAAATSPSPFVNGQPLQLPFWSDTSLWTRPGYYSTIQLGDIDGDGAAELIGRGPAGILVNKFDPVTGQWLQLPNGPTLSDAAGWNEPQYYSTIQLADIDGDGQAELLARGAGGIVAYHFNPGSSSWTQMPNGPGLSDAAGWNQPEYYSTIQCANIAGNNDRQAYLVARAANGMEVWQFNPQSQAWITLPAGPPLSDAAGWNQPQYYSTIQLADIDGDGQAELLARSSASIVAYHYSKLSGTWTQLPDGPELSNEAGWDQPHYYSTIQCANVAGNSNGQSYLLARSADGVEVWQFNPQNQAWIGLPDGPPLSDAAGWNEPKYYSTIQLADIDGDGQSELLARSAGAIVAYHFNPGSSSWTQMPNGPSWADGSGTSGWADPSHYSTIQCAKVTVTSGQAYLLGRNANGMETWAYQPLAQQWAGLSATFVLFTGGQLNAFNYLGQRFDSDGNPPDIRNTYDEAGFVSSTLAWLQAPQNYNQLPTDPPPDPSAPFTLPEWQAVSNQIQTELTYVGYVDGWFTNVNTLIQDIFASDQLTVSTVAETLELPSNDSDSVILTIFSILAGAAWAALAVAAPYASVAAGLLATALTAALAANGGGGDSIEVAYLNLQNELNNWFDNALSGAGQAQTAIVSDGGLLSAVGSMSQDGTWMWPDTLTSELVSAGRQQYTISLWQILLPLAWEIEYLINPDDPADYNYAKHCNKYSVPRGFPQDHHWADFAHKRCAWFVRVGTNIFHHKYPSLIAWNALFGSPADGGLGVPVADVFLGQNGWPRLKVWGGTPNGAVFQTPQDLLRAFIKGMEDLYHSSGRKVLLRELREALRFLNAGNTRGALRQLKLFKKKARMLARKHPRVAEDLVDILGAANQVLAFISSSMAASQFPPERRSTGRRDFLIP